AASDAPAKRRAMPATLRLRFTDDEDLCLLREVRAVNPFASPKGWTLVYTNLLVALTRVFTVRAIRDRVYLLMGYFRQQDTANLRKKRPAAPGDIRFCTRVWTLTEDCTKEGVLRSSRLQAQATISSCCPGASSEGSEGCSRGPHRPLASVVNEGSPAFILLMQAYMEDAEREEEEDLWCRYRGEPATYPHTGVQIFRCQAEMALREMQMSLEQLKYQEDAKDRAEARQALAEEKRAQAEE
ncbi:hypothetical protein HPB47_004357, partial [Ixodes persulcatus]